jgi:hypothetical protein
VSDEADQETVTAEVVILENVGVPGTEGAVVSAGGGGGGVEPELEYNPGRKLPTHAGWCPLPLLSEISVGVGFRFRYQGVRTDPGAEISWVIWLRDRLVL